MPSMKGGHGLNVFLTIRSLRKSRVLVCYLRVSALMFAARPVFFSIIGASLCLAYQHRLVRRPATPGLEGIIEFHHDVMFLLVFIVFFVLYMLSAAVTSFSEGSGNRNVFSHNTLLEVV